MSAIRMAQKHEIKYTFPPFNSCITNEPLFIVHLQVIHATRALHTWSLDLNSKLRSQLDRLIHQVKSQHLSMSKVFPFSFNFSQSALYNPKGKMTLCFFKDCIQASLSNISKYLSANVSIIRRVTCCGNQCVRQQTTLMFIFKRIKTWD